MNHICTDEEVNRARDVWEFATTSDWFEQRPEKVKELYAKYPSWKFYTDPSGTCARRVLGVEEYKSQEGGYELRLKVVTCMFGWVNDVVGGCKPEDVVEVDRYTNETALMKIKHTELGKLFMDPNGWIVLLYPNSSHD